MNKSHNDIDISILIPFYKGNQYICDTINSVFIAAKSVSFHFQYEIIVINDSPQIAVNLDNLFNNSSNKNLYIVNNEKNIGIHATRNVGLNLAKGEYILFLDQDDNILPTFFTNMFEKRKQNPSPDIIVANAICEQKNSEVNLYKNRFSFGVINRLFFYINDGAQIISPGQTIIKRSIIPDLWRKSYLVHNGADDYLLWMIMLLNKRQFVYIHKPLYRHHYTNKNLSNNVDNMKISEEEAAKILFENNYISKKTFNRLIHREKIQKALKSYNVISIKFWTSLSDGLWVIIAYIIVKFFRFR